MKMSWWAKRAPALLSASRLPANSAPSLDIFTICTGREDYLVAQFDILQRNRQNFREHIFVCNGYSPSRRIAKRLEALGSKIHRINQRLPVGACLERIKEHFTAEHTMKLDDDALPLGENFFKHLLALRDLLPEHVFSPFPVGLIGNRGGPEIIRNRKHDVVFSAATQTYYALRPVLHIGGFARISPSKYYRHLSFKEDGHGEDKEMSNVMIELGIPMVYVENAFVVDHAETAYGQQRRNPAYHDMKAKKPAERIG